VGVRLGLVGMVSAAVMVGLLAGCATSTPSTRGAVEAADLIGTWTIDETFSSPEQPFIDFADDGTWSASDGCNRVQGTWELGDEGALTTTAGPSTLMACDGAQLPLAMAQANYVVLSGDSLSIYSSAESTVTELVRSDDPDVGPMGLPIGLWVASDAADAPFLSLAADGTFSGNDGCNILSGSWEVADDSSISFGAIASTLKFCDGVDTWLSGAALGRVQDGVMTIQDADGLVLGQLTSE
jgi:heat shock protein HslJ